MTTTDRAVPGDVSRGVLRLIVGSVLISFSAVFVKIVDVGPTEAGFYRNLFGATALLIVVLSRRETLWRGSRAMGFAAAAAAFFAADIFFWHRSIEFVGPGLATILGNFQVFFLATVGVIVFREGATWRFLVSIPLAITGLFLLVGTNWAALPSSYKVGVLFGLLTAVAYAAYLLTLRGSQQSQRRLPTTSNLAVVSGLTALFLAGVVRVEGGTFAIPDQRTLWVLVAYGVICQSIGWIIILGALRTVPASRAGLLLLLQPTLTFIWDLLFFGRPTTLLETFGAVLALGAIYLGNTRRSATNE